MKLLLALLILPFSALADYNVEWNLNGGAASAVSTPDLNYSWSVAAVEGDTINARVQSCNGGACSSFTPWETYTVLAQATSEAELEVIKTVIIPAQSEAEAQAACNSQLSDAELHDPTNGVVSQCTYTYREMTVSETQGTITK